MVKEHRIILSRPTVESEIRSNSGSLQYCYWWIGGGRNNKVQGDYMYVRVRLSEFVRKFNAQISYVGKENLADQLQVLQLIP